MINIPARRTSPPPFRGGYLHKDLALLPFLSARSPLEAAATATPILPIEFPPTQRC